MIFRESLYILLSICTISLSSCSSIFLAAYGIKGNTKNYTNEQLLHKAEKLEIISYPMFKAKPSLHAFLDNIIQLDSNYFTTVKSLYQPLQVITFNKNGELIGGLANCDAGGFPNLKWEHLLNEFPPKSYYFNDTIPLNQNSLFGQFISVNKLKIEDNKPITLIVYSHFMGRQNRRFIKKALDYHKTHAIGSELIFVNYDSEELYE